MTNTMTLKLASKMLGWAYIYRGSSLCRFVKPHFFDFSADPLFDAVLLLQFLADVQAKAKTTEVDEREKKRKKIMSELETQRADQRTEDRLKNAATRVSVKGKKHRSAFWADGRQRRVVPTLCLARHQNCRFLYISCKKFTEND